MENLWAANVDDLIEQLRARLAQYPSNCWPVIAHEAGVSLTTISVFVRGKKPHNSTIGTLKALATVVYTREAHAV